MPGSLCSDRDKCSSSRCNHESSMCLWSMCQRALAGILICAASDAGKQNVSEWPNIHRCELLNRCEEEHIPEADTPVLKKPNAPAHRQIPRRSPLIHMLSGTFSTSYFAFHICPAALHPGKTEQATQEQTINCDLFCSIHLIHNRLCILARLSGVLLGLVCVYQGLPIA